jgi:hypothetical protein
LRFFRTFQQEIDAAFHVRIAVLVEVELRDMPEAEAGGQLVTEIMPGMVEGRHRLLLLPFGAAAGHPYGSMPPIRTDVRIDHFDRQESRVFGFEPDDLGQLLPHRLGDLEYSPLVHSPLQPFHRRPGQTPAEQRRRLVLDGLQHLAGVCLVG